MSKRVLEASVADSVFLEHVQVKEAFGKHRGESVTIPRVSNITEPTSPVLSEIMDIPEDTFTISTIALTVQELGRAVPFTGFARDMSMLDLENKIEGKLREQMTLVIDTLAATAAKAGKIKYAPTGLASNNITTNGTFGAAATSNMNVFHAEELSDYMYDTLKAEPAEGGDYVGIFRQLGLRGIMRDPSWEQWHVYTDPQAKYNGEVGRIDRIRFVRTNHAEALGKVGTGSVLGEGVVLGKDALAIAEAISPELRAAIPKGFGRFHSVAWYGVLRFLAPWNDSANSGEANFMHIGST